MNKKPVKSSSKYGLKPVQHPDNPKCGAKLPKKCPTCRKQLPVPFPPSCPRCSIELAEQPNRICKNDAGWKTDHPGQGKCKMHGGATPLRAGRFSGTKLYQSAVKRKSLKETLEEVANDPVRLELDYEIQLLRALILDKLKQEEDPDKEELANLADKVGAMVDRAHKHGQSSTISLATMNRVMEQMGIEVVAACQESKLNADTATKLCEIIERRWNGIRVGAYTSSDARN